MKKKFKTGSNSSACSTPPAVSLSAADDPYSFDEEEKGNAANPMPSSAEFNRLEYEIPCTLESLLIDQIAAIREILSTSHPSNMCVINWTHQGLLWS